MVFNFDGRNIKSFIDSLKTIVSVSKEDVNAISDLQNYIKNNSLQNYIKNNSDDDNFAINLKNDIISLRTTIKDPQLIGYIDNLIEKGEEAKISLSDAFTFKYGDNTKGFKNVSQLIKDFNALGDSTGNVTEAQKEFAQWTKTSNSNLGKYFSTVKDGKASSIGYGASLVGATAKTIALEAATVALNAAISFGISVAIQGAVTWISSLITREHDLAEAAKDAAGEIKETNDILDDYAEKIVKLRDELDSGNATLQRSTEIRKELMEVQNDLIRKYGLESEGIDLVTGSVEKQIQAIKNLKKTNFEDYFDKNQEAVENAVAAMNNQTLKLDSRLYKQWYQTDSKVIADTYDKIGEIIKNSGFDFKKESGLWTLTGDIYTIDEALDYLQDKIQELGKQRGLSNEMVESYRTAARYISEIRSGWVDNQVLNQYGDIYDQWVRYGEEYTDEYFALVEKRANYELAVQEGNAKKINNAKKDYLDKYNSIVNDSLKNSSPATAKVFEKEFVDIANFAKKQADLIKKYIGDSINSGYQAEQKYFIDNLSIEDLDIATKIPNLFENGLEGAKKKIQEWKDDPDNQIDDKDIVIANFDFDELNKALTKLSSKMKSVSSAFKEQKESGSLSADTIISIIESGYAAALMYDEQTGAVTLNKNAYLQLVKAEIEKRRVDIKIERDTAVQERLNAVTEYANTLSTTMYDAAEKTALLGKEQAKIAQNDELIKMWDAELAVLDKYESELDNVLSGKYGNSDKGGGSTTDEIKDAYTAKEKELQHLVNMGKKTEEKYWNDLFASDEYKNLLTDRVKYQDELNSIDEKYYTFRQNRHKKNAEEELKTAEDERKRGIIDAEQYAKRIEDIRQKYYGEDSEFAGSEYATEGLKDLADKISDLKSDIYDELTESLSSDGDRLLDDVLADADELSKKNIELFKNKGDLKTFKKNAEDIFKTVSASAKDALERGLITPERFKEIIDAYSKGLDSGIIQDIFDDGFDAIADKAKDNLDKMLITPDEYFKLLDEWGKKLNISEDVIKKLKETLSESDYLDAWDLKNGFDSKKSADNFELRAERIKYIFELAEQLYGKDGQDNIKAYNELIKQGLEDEQSLVEDYYDKEIEKLEKINDEEEKRQKAIELQMNLIKARQKLEDAKKQKNQLVFYNGTFEYMEDQEAVKSAQEDVLEAEKAILEQQVEDQKEALEERKKAASEFFNKVEGDVSGALERIEKFISGDTSVYEKPVDKANSISNESNNKINTIGNLGTKGLFEKLIILFGGIPANNSMRDFMESFASTLIGKQIIPTTIRDAITNNSSTTNNTAKTEIHIDKIFENLNMPQGTTKEQVEEFFKHLNQAILQRIPQVILDVKK